MNKYLKIIIISMSFILIIVWISLGIYITWKNSGTQIATLSLQLTILETMLAVGGILLAIAGLLGYQGIKRHLEAMVSEAVAEEIPTAVGKEVNKRLNEIERKLGGKHTHTQSRIIDDAAKETY